MAIHEFGVDLRGFLDRSGLDLSGAKCDMYGSMAVVKNSLGGKFEVIFPSGVSQNLLGEEEIFTWSISRIDFIGSAIVGRKWVLALF